MPSSIYDLIHEMWIGEDTESYSASSARATLERWRAEANATARRQRSIQA